VRSEPSRLWLYIGLSVALHAAVMGLPRPGPRIEPAPAPARLDVSLRPAAPPTPQQLPAPVRRPPASTSSQVEAPSPTQPIAPPAESPGPAAPLDLDLAKIVREVARDRTGKSIDELNAPRTTEQAKLGEAVAAAARPDCRMAHSSKGPVFAVVFLIADWVTDTGCRW